MDNKIEFEVEVKEAMLRKGITMTDIANELGVSVGYVSDIVKGNRKPEHYRKEISAILGLKGK
ncbi:MAG: helix-turn-helix transcriptional regulator [Tissierellia bacterium]|nr:helix-turn-helix transcriptional regulator [Tissierellia bacterium]